MYVAANPGKARPEADKQEMAAKYTPGDAVIPKVKLREKSARERRADEEDRRLLDEVREMSLRDATAGLASSEVSSRRRRSHSRDTSSRSRRPQSLDSRHATGNLPDASRSGDLHRRTVGDNGQGRDRLRSDSRQRQVEHQASLRSLIGSSATSERNIEREIEDFARQIQEEGLLDGLDLDDIDLTRDDELSRRITEAYRRRQRERSRNGPSRRNSHTQTEFDPSNPEGARFNSRLRPPRNSSSSRVGSRSASANGQLEDSGVQSVTASANLEVRDISRRPRRRTASGGRSATTPILSSTADTRPAARSQTDLALRPRTSDPIVARQASADSPSVDSRPSAGPTTAGTGRAATLPSVPSENNGSFASRAPRWDPNAPDASSTLAPPHEINVAQPRRHHVPSELAIVQSGNASPMSSRSASPSHRRHRSHLYPEPAISCSRCDRQHIEYELHYHCSTCAGGEWNICLACYRSGKGCQHWFGFGHGAWTKWEKMRQEGDEQLARPHMLVASRYLPPPSTPGGADGRKTLTTDDPLGRLETGTFCARCLAWTNHCYWRCDVCNEGDWGFCNNCVNQGKSCTHMLLPLTHEATPVASQPPSPRSPGRPPAAAIYNGPHASSIGAFKPLTFRTRCDVCQDSISPSQTRYHCSRCTSALVPDAPRGDYDICSSCYNSLVSRAQISGENGHSGWRRCLNGHRMIVVGFTEGRVGQWRYVEREMVGGRALRSEPFDGFGQDSHALQKWTWKKGKDRWTRLATRDVAATAPSSLGTVSFARSFPPDGGTGLGGKARWAWYPKAGAEDELLFPKGAEIQEVEDVNGDWFYGTYMGAKGLFPAPYIRLG
ncbi:hypothetical protein AAL_00485 [Moelleriella libera RCEF 2490]|uniref:SH3 domain-containing protein n=1 Tax=Moelleriella libera RCEF 2490 TaxID=1081109 RepID=A0A166UVP0_9HYPO|nr:hypothetical protein AAL_00485 [Moelleriella libera RCEF 2490]